MARELSRTMGVLEPIQTLGTLEGQMEELHRIPAAEADEGRGDGVAS